MLNYVFPGGAACWRKWSRTEAPDMAAWWIPRRSRGRCGSALGFPTSATLVTLDGEKLSLIRPPLPETTGILVPLRGIAEALDFTVTWDQASNWVPCERERPGSALRSTLPTPG